MRCLEGILFFGQSSGAHGCGDGGNEQHARFVIYGVEYLHVDGCIYGVRR